MNLSYQQVKNLFVKKNYKFYDRTFDLNVFGIRTENSVSNKFDDWIGVAFWENGGRLKLYPATTDPGKHWLLNPMNKNGTIIMVPGQYSSVYDCNGLHGRSGKNPYRALEQIAKIQYVRDNNRDDKLDFSLYRDPVKLAAFGFWDICKTNLHRASMYKLVQLIDLYSAGCQVIQYIKHFEELLFLCDMQIGAGLGHKLTYTLFEERDL